MSHIHDTVSIAVERGGAAVTHTASGAAFAFGLSAQDTLMAASLVISLITFAMTWWYKHQHLKLAREQADAGQLRAGGER